MPAKVAGSSTACSVAASLWTPNNSTRAFSETALSATFSHFTFARLVVPSLTHPRSPNLVYRRAIQVPVPLGTGRGFLTVILAGGPALGYDAGTRDSWIGDA